MNCEPLLNHLLCYKHKEEFMQLIIISSLRNLFALHELYTLPNKLLNRIYYKNRLRKAKKFYCHPNIVDMHNVSKFKLSG